jgi:uroporphyrinogen decarboxylase
MAVTGAENSHAKGMRLMRALTGERQDPPPWWLMRQAGRYLPEYRALRAQAGSFLEFCLNPALAAEATLQPVRRFGMDAAILFADILLVAKALGQQLDYGDDGPRLAEIDTSDLAHLSLVDGASLDPVYETVRLSRASLPPHTALIGFAGAPWTVATYMVEGGSSRDYRKVRAWGYRDPAGFGALIETLVEITADYLQNQIEAGANVIQLFDSWAGVLAESEFERWVIAPTQQIVSRLKQRFPSLPIIGFPRGAGFLYERYISETAVDVISLDTTVPLARARHLQAQRVVQGNLDPVALLVGGNPLESAVRAIRQALGERCFVFNLGHGILPQTPPEHVAALARLLAEPLVTG